MSANKFKVGDKVKARKNLIEGRQYGYIHCNRYGSLRLKW